MPEANGLPQTRTLLIAGTILAAPVSFWTDDHGPRAAVERRASAAASLVAAKPLAYRQQTGWANTLPDQSKGC